jgi:dipeptidyl aminopeptidase/acylaminoacyl peptidase
MGPVFYTAEVHDFDQYFATRRYQDLDIRPDGEEVAYATDITGNFNVWRQSAEGGWSTQLTAFLRRAARRVAWSPDGRQLAIAADKDGNENEQLYVMPAVGGKLRRLTSRDDARFLLAQQPWSPDGRTLACASNSEDPANFDLVMIDTATGSAVRLSREPLFHQATCWSPDGRLLAGTIERSNVHQDIVVADRETGECLCLTVGRDEARRWPVGFSADASALYLLTDEGRPFRGLARLDLGSGEMEWIKRPDWDIDYAAMSADARRILYVVNEDAIHRLHLFDRNSGIEPQLPRLSMGYVQGVTICSDGTRAAVLHDASRRPAEAVVLDLARRDLRTITQGMVGGIPEEEMVEPEIIRYQSFDRKIPSLLYRPRGEPPAGGWPAVLHIHGGPERQEQPLYRPIYQFLLSRGFVILAPNIRGSTGYGKKYQKLIYRDFGGNDVRDLDAAAKFLKSQSYVDGRRLAVSGFSYGGFAALSCATRLPEHWAAAVDVFGPSNLVTYALSTPKSWHRFMRGWVGDPVEEQEDLRCRSPITYAERIRCPLLVIQGAHDPRVVRSESDQLVGRIREMGGTVEYLVFEDEGHGFLKRENKLRAGEAITGFLLRHLAR